MKGIFKVFGGVFLMAYFSSCNKDTGPFNTEEPVVNENDLVSYSSQVQPIFDNNCVSCHNQSHSKLDLQPAVSYQELLITGFSAPYVDTANPGQSNLYLHLTGTLSQMPPAAPLAQSEQDIIFYWISQGAEDN